MEVVVFGTDSDMMLKLSKRNNYVFTFDGHGCLDKTRIIRNRNNDDNSNNYQTAGNFKLNSKRCKVCDRIDILCLLSNL